MNENANDELFLASNLQTMLRRLPGLHEEFERASHSSDVTDSPRTIRNQHRYEFMTIQKSQTLESVGSSNQSSDTTEDYPAENDSFSASDAASSLAIEPTTPEEVQVHLAGRPIASSIKISDAQIGATPATSTYQLSSSRTPLGLDNPSGVSVINNPMMIKPSFVTETETGEPVTADSRSTKDFSTTVIDTISIAPGPKRKVEDQGRNIEILTQQHEHANARDAALFGIIVEVDMALKLMRRNMEMELMIMQLQKEQLEFRLALERRMREEVDGARRARRRARDR